MQVPGVNGQPDEVAVKFPQEISPACQSVSRLDHERRDITRKTRNLAPDGLFFQIDGSHFRLYNPHSDPPPIYGDSSQAREERTKRKPGNVQRLVLPVIEKIPRKCLTNA